MSEITITIKSGQNKWEVKIEPSSSVEDMKNEIFKLSDIPVENQRLIYSGKILKNELTLDSYKIQDGHSIHLVKSAAKKASGETVSGDAAASATNAAGTETAAGASNVPQSFATGSSGAFNPLADLTSARYAGYGLNLPSADSFGPDGGLNNMPSQEDVFNMMENPMVQSQMNELLSNPQMLDYLIEQNPQLRAMGPNAREMLTSPFMRQMMTNPQMMRQSMAFQNMMGGVGGAATGTNDSGFPLPGSSTATEENNSNNNNNSTTDNNTTNPPVNPFASMFGNMPPPNPALLSQMFGAGAQSPMGSMNPAPTPADNRPPEEKYEQQLRQLNDMGFFEFDRNVAALKRSGGSVQGALDALLNGSV